MESAIAVNNLSFVICHLSFVLCHSSFVTERRWGSYRLNQNHNLTGAGLYQRVYTKLQLKK